MVNVSIKRIVFISKVEQGLKAFKGEELTKVLKMLNKVIFDNLAKGK